MLLQPRLYVPFKSNILILASSPVATQLSFGTQPSNANAYASISPSITVEIKDSNGDVVTSDNSTQVTLSFDTNPPTGDLLGTLTKTAVNGVATFNDIAVDRWATGYKLAANATGLTGAISNTFDIAQVTWVYDTFTDTAGTNIQSHTPDTNVYGHSWAQSKSNGGTQSNTFVKIQTVDGGTRWQSSVDFYGSVIDIEHTDCEMEMKWKNISGGAKRHGFIIRYASDGNEHEVQWRQDFTDVRLYPVVNGSQGTSQLIIGSHSTTTGNIYTIKIVVYKTEVKVYENGTLLGSGTLSLNPTSTKFGILRRADVAWFDDLTIKSP